MHSSSADTLYTSIKIKKRKKEGMELLLPQRKDQHDRNNYQQHVHNDKQPYDNWGSEESFIFHGSRRDYRRRRQNWLCNNLRLGGDRVRLRHNNGSRLFLLLFYYWLCLWHGAVLNLQRQDFLGVLCQIVKLCKHADEVASSLHVFSYSDGNAC